MSDARSGAQDGTSDVRSGAQDGTNDVRSGVQVRLRVPAQLPAWLPGRNSNSTGSAKSVVEAVGQPPRELTARSCLRRSLATWAASLRVVSPLDTAAVTAALISAASCALSAPLMGLVTRKPQFGCMASECGERKRWRRCRSMADGRTVDPDALGAF